MRDVATGEGGIFKHAASHMRHDVDVSRASSVMSRDQGLYSNDSKFVGGLDTTQEGVVDVGGIGAIPIAVGADARVDSCAIAMPKLGVDRRHWLACIDVNHLEIECKWDTFLIFNDVVANVFTRYPYEPKLAMFS